MNREQLIAREQQLKEKQAKLMEELPRKMLLWTKKEQKKYNKVVDELEWVTQELDTWPEEEGDHNG